MFTGIIEELGIIEDVMKNKEGARIRIKGNIVNSSLQLGDSIAVNGVCLTVADLINSIFEVEIMPETLNRTNLAYISPRDRVNLERARSLGERMGGHIVTGHVDEVGVIKAKYKSGLSIVMEVKITPSINKYLVVKGSASIDGVSLTIVNINDDNLTVHLIPHTLNSTTLGFKKPGDYVNIETDILAKHLEKLIENYLSLKKKYGLTEDYLKSIGYK